MSILDAYLTFTGTLNGATATIADGTLTDAPTTGTQDTSNILDLGVKSGIPSSANGGGARDMAIGDDPMLKLLVQVVTAFTGGTSLQVELQGAPDGGAGTPGSWTVMWLGPAVLEANLLQGTYVANVDVPRTIPGQVLPRFLKLTCITVGTHTTGDIYAGIVLDRFDQVGLSGTISGYPAGINIAN